MAAPCAALATATACSRFRNAWSWRLDCHYAGGHVSGTKAISGFEPRHRHALKNIIMPTNNTRPISHQHAPEEFHQPKSGTARRWNTPIMTKGPTCDEAQDRRRKEAA